MEGIIFASAFTKRMSRGKARMLSKMEEEATTVDDCIEIARHELNWIVDDLTKDESRKIRNMENGNGWNNG